jgi:hypothetical protein
MREIGNIKFTQTFFFILIYNIKLHKKKYKVENRKSENYKKY